MADEGGQETLLGRETPQPQVYTPEILQPIPRAANRKLLGLGKELPFHGADTWHAYELSWLDGERKPVVHTGIFTVPAASPNIVESKSFKLYLNSLNNKRFATTEQAVATIESDVGAAAGAPISLSVHAADDPAMAGAPLPGECLDHLPLLTMAPAPDPAMLSVADTGTVEEQLHTHLMRSLCPVTAQPDWASVWLHYRGAPVDHRALLTYIVAYRSHPEFHEQCVERIFMDVQHQCEPEFLHIQALYTRRGGMDISPYRSSEPGARSLPRLDRQ